MSLGNAPSTELLSVLAISKYHRRSRASSISSVMSDDHRGPNFDSLRRDVQDIKEMIRKLYKQVDNFDAKRAELLQDFEHLKKANKDFSMKVRDLHEVLKNPPHVRVYSDAPTSPHSVSKYVDRLDTRDYSYGSTRSSRSSSFRNILVSGTVDDYDDDDLSDDNYDERTFTKSVDNFELEDTSDA